MPSLLRVLKESPIFSKREFSSARRYRADKDKSDPKPKPSFLLGLFFLFIALDYFTFALISLCRGNVSEFLLSLGLTVAVLLSYILLRKGEQADLAYKQAKYAKAPHLPRKLIGAILLSIATTTSAYFGAYGFVGALMLGGSTLFGWYLYYGFDITEDKLEGYGSDAAAQRIMTLIVESEKRVAHIRALSKGLHSLEVASQLQEVASGFTKIIDHVALEPEDYDVARRYLVSYLGEIESMSETFYKLDIEDKSASMKGSFLELLNETAEKLTIQYDKFLDDDMAELDIKISVMKKRFQGEP